MQPVRQSKARHTTPVLFRSNDEMLNRVRAICDEYDCSMSHFIRESVRRNLTLYEERVPKP